MFVTWVTFVVSAKRVILSPQKPAHFPEDPRREEDFGQNVESDVDIQLIESGGKPQDSIVHSPIGNWKERIENRVGLD